MSKQKNDKSIKILLVQIVNRNLGDAVIADNTEYLIRKALPKKYKKHTTILRYNITSGGMTPIPYADAIVFAGGGLIKFKQERFYEPVIQILKEADACGIPVFFNAVGVEGYDREDERCRRLQDALTLSCVKGLSCRDDVRTLEDTYLLGCYKHVSSVPDPAVWSKKTYKDALEKKEKNKCIGLGITRHDLFEDYGTPGIDHSFLLHFWKDVTSELERRGYTWKLFTNGLGTDEDFAYEVLSYIGHGEKLPAPVEAKQLIQTIHQFQGIIAGRMHSNIVAYALGIPSIGFVWNQKLAFWGKRIGYPERFLEATDMVPFNVVNHLEDALKEGITPMAKKEKQTIITALHDFFEEHLHPRKVYLETPIPYQDHLIATALGGKFLQYDNMNSPDSIVSSLKGGFKFLEVDVRMDADGRLVCVNGWNKGTYQKLQLQMRLDEVYPPVSTEEFLASKYYGLYPTATLPEVLRQFRRMLLLPTYADAVLILDIGRPTEGEAQEQFFEKLKEAFHVNTGGPFMSSSHIWIRLQRQRDYKLLRQQKLDFKVVYYLPTPENASPEEMEPLYKNIQFCHEKHIDTVSLPAENWTDGIAALCKESNLKTMVFSYSRAGNICRAIQMGADYVGSYHLTPQYLNRLTNQPNSIATNER